MSGRIVCGAGFIASIARLLLGIRFDRAEKNAIRIQDDSDHIGARA